MGERIRRAQITQARKDFNIFKRANNFCRWARIHFKVKELCATINLCQPKHTRCMCVQKKKILAYTQAQYISDVLVFLQPGFFFLLCRSVFKIVPEADGAAAAQLRSQLRCDTATFHRICVLSTVRCSHHTPLHPLSRAMQCDMIDKGQAVAEREQQKKPEHFIAD